MRTAGSPFTNPGQVSGPLYASADRLARRTSALHRARVSGRNAAEAIADLAAAAIGTESALVADVGCGRGTTTRLLAGRLPQARLIVVDLSAALLTVARSRLTDQRRAAVICADFHRLPIADARLDLVVAAFCLYHSPSPADVITEIARCLLPGGTAIIAVKSADSYRELDHLVAASGLDAAAEDRPSLYQAAHTGNIEPLASTALRVEQVTSETHRFSFPTLAAAAAYLATSPKYQLPPSLSGDPAALTAALRQRTADEPVTATSVVTYLVATRQAADSAR
jgi:ubiquinone/menaquinone biosynthesis C-methylase UbiE